jgi:alpha-tubulin suppressor-like RCC1 family protein
MDSHARRPTRRSYRRVTELVVAAVASALTLAIAAPSALASSGVLAWGDNNSGQLGNGTCCEPSLVPAPVKGLTGVTAVAGGLAYSLALLENGEVRAWGSNNVGQLGDGTIIDKYLPVAVKEVSNVTAISAGEHHNLALLSDGTVMAWGYNGYGQLGDGEETERHAPEKVPGLSGVKAIFAGPYLSLALLEDGTVKAWGNNSSGQLGNGTCCESSPVPVTVKELSGVTAIAAGDRHSLARLSNGTIAAWGSNVYGQLGDGTEIDKHSPVAVEGLTGVATVNAGLSYSLALLETGTVKTWGEDNQGQLGNGTCCEHSKVPVSVKELSGVTAISAGTYYGLATLGSGTLMAWGNDQLGQLGNGTCCEQSNVPVPVSGLGGVTAISAGGFFGLAVGQPVPPPIVTKVSPAKGPVTGGTTVKITGTDFTGATAVKFGSINASSFKVNSATSITATSPAEAAGIVHVRVTAAGLTSAIATKDRFKFTPTITKVSPNSGSKAGGTTVTISGTGFALGKTATVFKFGTPKATSVECASSTTCTAVTPAHAVGPVDVKATVNKVSSPKNAPADQFTYN